jgi:NTE family protein
LIIRLFRRFQGVVFCAIRLCRAYRLGLTAVQSATEWQPESSRNFTLLSINWYGIGIDQPCIDTLIKPLTPDSHSRRLILRTLGTVTAVNLVLSGCSFTADIDHNDADAPTAANGALPFLPADSLALVLGSGGPRGFAHIGVLKALDELKIKPDLIVGASIGSLVGALYAAGMSGLEIERIALQINVTDVLRFAIGARERFAGTAIASWVNRSLEHRPIEKLGIPFAAVAVREAELAPMAFTQGNLGVAIQASCAIPGTFTPVRIRGQTYIDPDKVTPVPVRLARRLGAARVLSVDVSAHEDRAPAGAERFREGDFAKRALIEPDVKSANLNLHPYFGYWVSFTEEFRRRAIDAAFEQTLLERASLGALAKSKAPA